MKEGKVGPSKKIRKKEKIEIETKKKKNKYKKEYLK